MTLEEIQAETAADTERLARLTGETRPLLLRRLREARSVLKDEYLKLFTKASVFDFENKRLISTCGTYALQWRLRPEPSKPVAYHNQQTNRGSVSLERLK